MKSVEVTKMNNKKILSLTMATVMAVSGGPILVGCSNDKSTNYDDFKKVVSNQDKEDEEEAKNNNVFRGGYVGNSFFLFCRGRKVYLRFFNKFRLEKLVCEAF